MAEPLPDFVSRRRPQWEELSKLLEAQRSGSLKLLDLYVLDRLYRRASSDLARAQAFYPGTDAHRFLNQLCSTAYGAIYQPPRDRLAGLKDFYLRGFPCALREETRFLAASTALFSLGLLVGAAVVLFEPHGAELLVPAPLREAVAAKQMWTDSLLSVMPPGVAASHILTNNLTVTIATFAFGAAFGLGTAWLLLSNGVHLGSVVALCAREGMGYSLLSFVAAHGPVELSVIVISGAAGLMVGHALIEPGERTRAAFVKERSIKAVKLVVGCAPFLALIGVIEGYVSPGDLFPTPLKIALGLALGGLFWAYLCFAGREGHLLSRRGSGPG
ncbi:MAG: stage II sporulation protein M [Myxococcales bacterium]|nr:stage II sporulation protein M [Myxococcales bacterium]